ncbi:MAG: DUF3352 domain-containing protein [Bacteroidota bacterium]|nr:DUF3352 domain-containing protein [Bacteroidota bacterium]
MKRNIIFLLAGLIIVLGATGFFYYKLYHNQEEIEVFSLIPENAIAVYETKNIIRNWNTLQEKKLWPSLSLLPVFSKINNTLIELDSITGKEGNLDKMFRNNSLCISFHQTSKASLGSVYYFKLKDLESYDIFNKVLSGHQKKKNVKKEERTYLGEKIREVKDVSSNKIFSYIIYKDHFAGSFSPVLLEDVIRNIKDDESSISFKEKNRDLFTMSRTSTDEGDLYINTTKLNSIVSIFSGEIEDNNITSTFALASSLNLEIKDHEIYFTGYTLAGKTNHDYFLGTLKGQKPGPLQVTNLIPNRTATLFHSTFHDGPLWYQNLVSFWNKKSPDQEKFHIQLQQTYEIDPKNFFIWMSGEIALATLQSINVKNPDRLLYLRTNDINEAYNQINKLAFKAEAISGDSLYKESFSEIEIRQLNIREFPSMLLGDNYSGFPISFYAAKGNYLIIGNSLQVVKSTLADIEADNVWGKSVAMNQYFEKTLSDANISYIINTQRNWNSFVQQLNSNWLPSFNNYITELKNFGFVSMQLSGIEDKFYTSINLLHQNETIKDKEGQKFNLASNIAVDASIITKPFYLKNPGESELQVLLQDSLFNLYKISLDGSIHWKDSIGERIIGDIHQIDYLKNGQLQYAFITPHAIHILSKEGSYINNNFPYQLEEEVIFMNIADYDNNKDYRFLISDVKGNLFMLDKQMQTLEGWNPGRSNFKSATAPHHIRIREKDCIIYLQENGELYVMSIKGGNYSGFPLNLQGNFKNEILIEQGPTFSQTFLTTISEKGELVKVNLEGKIINKEQFYRPSRETRFKICIDELKKDFIIARQELGILTLLDSKSEVILEKDYITSSALEIQYFNVGIEKEVYAVTDKIQEFTYLYDYKGNLINSRPIDSSHKVSLHYNEGSGKYEVFANYDSQFSRINFIR